MKLIVLKDQNNKLIGLQLKPLDDRAIEVDDKEYQRLLAEIKSNIK